MRDGQVTGSEGRGVERVDSLVVISDRLLVLDLHLVAMSLRSRMVLAC